MLGQDAYKAELASAYSIEFNSLLALNNMPIKRFADYLLRRGQLQDYMQVGLQLHTTVRFLSWHPPKFKVISHEFVPMAYVLTTISTMPLADVASVVD